MKPGRFDQRFWWGLGTFVACGALSIYGARSILTMWGVLALWSAIGVTVGLTLAAPARAWWAIGLGSAAGSVAATLLRGHHHEQLLAGLITAPLGPLAAVAGGLAVRRLCRDRPSLASPTDVAWTLAVGAAATSGACAALVLLAGRLSFPGSSGVAFSALWIRSMATTVVVLPVVLSLAEVIRQRPRRRTARQWAARLGLVALTIGITLAVFRERVNDWRAFVLLLGPLAMLVLTAFLVGPRLVAVNAIISGLGALAFTGQGLGPIASLLPRSSDADLAASLFVITAASLGMLTAAAIAERANLSRQVAAERDRFRLAAEGSRLVVWDWDIASDRTVWTGRPPFDLRSAGDAEAGRWWSRSLHPDDHRRVTDQLNAHLRGEGRYEVEYRLRMPDGQFRWFRSAGQAVHDSSGRAVRMTGILIDVHDRVTAERSLAASEALYRVLVEASGELVSLRDRDGKSVYISPSCEALFDATTAELEAQDWRERIHPDDRPHIERLRERAMAGESIESQYRAVNRHGRTFWMDLTARPVRDADGNVTHILSVARDVTDRVEQERRLLESQKRYHALFDQSPLPYIVVRRSDFRILDANAAAERLYGYSRDELLALCATDLRPPEHVPAFIALMRGGPVEPPAGGWKHRRKDGSELSVEVAGQDVEIDGVPARLVLIRDVTEARRTQLALAEQHRILELIAGDTPLQVILDEIVRAVQSHEPRLRGSILLLDDDRQTFRTASGPDLPAEYRSAVEGIRIGPAVGSCGTAMWRRERVITRSIATDPLWQDYHPLALKHGLAACWSEPIVNSSGAVLGSLAVYAPVESEPSDAMVGVLAAAARLTAIAVERRRLEAALADTEARFRALFQQASVGIARVSPSGRFLMTNQRACEILGRSAEELSGRSFAEITHPDDVARNVDLLRESLPDRDGYTLEKRYVRPDGAVIWASVAVRIVRDALGQPDYLIAAIQDISERVEANRRLAASEERYRRLLTDVRVVAWEADPATWRFTFVAGRAEDILGYPPEKWLEDGFWLSIIHPEDRERAANFCLHQTSLGIDHEFEHRAVRSDGRTVWLRDLVSVEVRDGRATTLRGVIVDVTEQRAAELALRESQATNLALLSALPDLLFRVDSRGTYISFHAPPGVPLLAPPEQFIGRTMREVLPPDIAEAGMRALAATFETGAIHTYEYQTTRNDRRHWWECRVVQTSATEALIVVRDVTSRREAEEALRDSQRRFSLLINQSPIGVIVWNTRFEIVQWNPAAQRIFGFSPQEVIGRHGDLIIPPEVRPRVDELWRDLMGQRGGSHAINENLTKSGDRIICEWHNTPLVSAEGAVIGVSSFVQDVTERVMSERRQALMMQELDHRVKNNMAAVLSLAEQTGRTTSDFDQFQATFMGRVRALARMHSALAASRWRGADMRSLIRQTVEPYSGPAVGRLTLAGPPVELPPRIAQSLAMTFNELATNAAKHGALSVAAGRVEVTWNSTTSESHALPTLELSWIERDGPQTRPPASRGLGMDLIEGAIIYQLGGSVVFHFGPGGLECSLRAVLQPDETPFHLPAANGVR